MPILHLDVLQTYKYTTTDPWYTRLICFSSLQTHFYRTAMDTHMMYIMARNTAFKNSFNIKLD